MGFLKRRLAAFLALGALCAAVASQAQQAPEAAVKAAFLFRFAGYVEWPAATFPQPDSPFVFGVAGNDEVAAELERIVAGRSVNNRRAVVRRVSEVSQARSVHLLFAPAREGAALLREARAHGALTVTDGERGLDTGSAITFVTAENRVGFEVSLDAAEKSGLRISSRMLAVARRVVPKT